jgi:hypothetical protein
MTAHGKTNSDKMTNHQINYIIWIPLLVSVDFQLFPPPISAPPWVQPASRLHRLYDSVMALNGCLPLPSGLINVFGVPMTFASASSARYLSACIFIVLLTGLIFHAS